MFQAANKAAVQSTGLRLIVRQMRTRLQSEGAFIEGWGKVLVYDTRGPFLSFPPNLSTAQGRTECVQEIRVCPTLDTSITIFVLHPMVAAVQLAGIVQYFQVSKTTLETSNRPVPGMEVNLSDCRPFNIARFNNPRQHAGSQQP